MNDQTSAITTTFQNLLTIYQETAKLLEDAGSMLEKHGYRCFHGNTVGTEQSKSINYPSWWITPYVSRYFAREDNPVEIRAFGVFFVDRDHTPIEPLILTACFKMKKTENDEPPKPQYWYLKEAWFSLGHDRARRETVELKGTWDFSVGKIRAVPLSEVKDQESLQEKVIDPLIAMSC